MSECDEELKLMTDLVAPEDLRDELDVAEFRGVPSIECVGVS